MPHLSPQSGPQFNVGNPLALDFLGKMNSGVLASQAGEVGQNTLQLNQMISFWRSARNRIRYSSTCTLHAMSCLDEVLGKSALDGNAIVMTRNGRSLVCSKLL